MTWLQKLMTPRIRTEGQTSKGKVPEGVWEKCGGCGAVLYRPELERNLMVCPKCGHHHAISARARLAAFLDEDSVIERTIVDKNASIGRGCRITNAGHVQDGEGPGFYIRDGIVVVLKNAVIPDGTVI